MRTKQLQLTQKHLGIRRTKTATNIRFGIIGA